jgi:hypothetical protein
MRDPALIRRRLPGKKNEVIARLSPAAPLQLAPMARSWQALGDPAQSILVPLIGDTLGVEASCLLLCTALNVCYKLTL